MTITIFYFAQLAEERGQKQETLQISVPMTLYELFFYIFKREPSGLRFAQNHEYVSEQSNIEHGDEIAFIPPLGGG